MSLTKKELASAGTDTSPKCEKTGLELCNSSTVCACNSTTKFEKCQEALKEVKSYLLVQYEDMDAEEQKIFDLGQLYEKVCAALEDGDNENSET